MCNTYTPIDKRELLVVQNRSTLMALTEARSFETQSIYSLGVSQIRSPENNEAIPLSIMQFFKVLGLNSNWKDGDEWLFDKNRSIDNIQYQKIVCCTDPTDQGDNIKYGLLMWIGALYPQLFIQGHIFEIEFPKYKVFLSEQVKYLYEEDAKIEPYQVHEAIHGLSLASMTRQDLIQCCTNYQSRGILRVDWDQQTEDNMNGSKFKVQIS